MSMPAAGQGNTLVTILLLLRILVKSLSDVTHRGTNRADLLINLDNTVVKDIWDVNHKVEDGRTALVAYV